MTSMTCRIMGLYIGAYRQGGGRGGIRVRVKVRERERERERGGAYTCDSKGEDL